MLIRTLAAVPFIMGLLAATPALAIPTRAQHTAPSEQGGAAADDDEPHLEERQPAVANAATTGRPLHQVDVAASVVRLDCHVHVGRDGGCMFRVGPTSHWVASTTGDGAMSSCFAHEPRGGQ